jgi:transcription initiation factor TFIID subunit 7
MSSLDDLIVVDDVADERSDNNASGRNTRRRASALQAATAISMGNSAERTTRSVTSKSKGGGAGQPKLKLKLSDKAAAQVSGMSFLGAYDRELDSSDDDLTFEEQFILRMPPGEDCDRLRKTVSNREVSQDVWFKFKGTFCSLTQCVCPP